MGVCVRSGIQNTHEDRKASRRPLRALMAARVALLLVVWAGTVDAALDMGARVLPGGRGVSFKVWAPHASAVNVELRKASAETDTIALQKGDGNTFYGETPNAEAGDDFRYAVEVSYPQAFARAALFLATSDISPSAGLRGCSLPGTTALMWRARCSSDGILMRGFALSLRALSAALTTAIGSSGRRPRTSRCCMKGSLPSPSTRCTSALFLPRVLSEVAPLLSPQTCFCCWTWWTDAALRKKYLAFDGARRHGEA